MDASDEIEGTRDGMVVDIPTLDLTKITLGQMAAIEAASGRSFDDLIAGRAGRLLAALFLREYTRSGRPPSWSQLADLRPRVVSSSPSRSPRTGRQKASSG